MPHVAIPGYFPTPDPDPRVAAGTVYAIDFSRIGGAISGTTVPNMAGTVATALVGSAVPSLTIVNTHPSSATGGYEVTSKGDLNLMVSQTVDTASGEGTALSMGANVRTYLQAHNADQWYLSVWVRPTRANLATSPTVIPYAAIRQTNMNGIIVNVGTTTTTQGGIPGTSDSRRTGFIGTGTTEQFIAIGANGLGSASAIIDTLVYCGAWTGSLLHKAPSFILRGLFLENLTASGRSFATVSALDQSAWSTHLAKLTGETYSAPTA